MRRADTLLRKIVRACALGILTCTLCTCVSPLPPENSAGGARTVTVYLGGDGRAAMPFLPEDLIYEVTATCPGEKDANGKASGDPLHCEIELSGTDGAEWTITVNAYLTDPEAPLLTGSATLTVPKRTVSVVLNAANGTGKVNLPITVDDATRVTKLTVSGTNTGLDGDYPATDSKITIYQTGIATGTYDALFSFYSGDVLIARCWESINVCANLTTSRWVTAGNSILINSTGEFKLTSEAVERLTSTTLYVKGTGGTLGATGSDSNPGTWLEPFATLQAAVNRVNALNNVRNVAYTIFIDGTVEYSTASVDMAVINPGDSGKKLNLTICGRTGPTKDSLTAKASRILYIGANASVTVTNLALTRGTGVSTSDSGGGVYVAGGTFTLDSGGMITGCSATKDGGGVYVAGGTFTLDSGGMISLCSATNGGGVYVTSGTFTMKDGAVIAGNKATGNGGGMYVDGGNTSGANFVMETGAVIAGNNATGNGGGMYVSNCKFTMNGGTIGGSLPYNTPGGNRATMGNDADYGGGVYVAGKGVFKMSGGSVSYNSSDYRGGGIYAATGITLSGTVVTGNTASSGGGGGVCVNVSGGTVTMEAGKISGNTTGTGSLGGGVHVADGTFALTGGTIGGSVPYNADTPDKTDMGNNAGQGGGVYVAATNTAKFTMEAGKISKNTASTNGGGICIRTNGIITLKNSSDTAEISGNVAGYGGGVYTEAGLTLSTGNVVIKENTATEKGGGVYVSAGTFAMSAGEILGNTVTGTEDTSGGGGVYVSGGTFKMSAGKISKNTASTNGGGIRIGSGGNIDLSGTAEINGNTAAFGGGVHTEAGLTLSSKDAVITENTATANGGGVYVKSGTFAMSAGAISGNTAENSIGGGVWLCSGAEQEEHTMSGGKISGNTAGDGSTKGDGGGVYAAGKFTMSGTAEISVNTAKSGGGIYVTGSGNFTMENGRISGNNSTGNGGGVWTNGTFTMTGGTIGDKTPYVETASAEEKAAMGNCAGSSDNPTCGGGVYNRGTFELTGGTISGNVATNTGGGVNVIAGKFTMRGGLITVNSATNGGGVHTEVSGAFELTGGTISGNTATDSGGGVFKTGSGAFTMEAGTISDNKANGTESICGGGGVYIEGTSAFNMSGGTISGNTAASGGGIYVPKGCTFKMSGGNISGNTATANGGGVYANGGEFTMEAGTISDNSASAYGGGVVVSGTFTMEAGTITGNAAKTGGGVMVVTGTFTMNNGLITANTATNSSGGGGVYVFTGSIFTINGGTVNGNISDQVFRLP